MIETWIYIDVFSFNFLSQPTDSFLILRLITVFSEIRIRYSSVARLYWEIYLAIVVRVFSDNEISSRWRNHHWIMALRGEQIIMKSRQKENESEGIREAYESE